ncbi:tripartite motif-containing protein 16-like [Xenentodon cancila]
MVSLSIDIEGKLKETEHTASTKGEPEDPTVQASGAPLLQDVLCDSCMDNPSKALKSCLTCMVSYCEAHLRPHLEKAKFQNHRLVDPLHEIDCQTCEVHRLPLKSFCLLDSCCVCRDCESEEHRGHATELLAEARVQKETVLQRKHEEISKSVSDVEEAIRKLQNNNDFIKSSVQEVCVVVEQQFASLQTTVGEVRKRVEEELEVEQEQALRQAEGIQAHLEQRRAEFMKILAQMNTLSKSKSDADFLQGYSEWEKILADVFVPTVRINRMDQLNSYVQAVTDLTQELCHLIFSFYGEKITIICKNGAKASMPDSQPSTLPDPESHEDFLKYAKDLTFDPDTIHNFLRITEDNKKLTNTSPWQHGYPYHPSRFEHWRQAMTLDSLYLGRHYIEAELRGEGAHVGVTCKTIDRKGEQSSSSISGNEFSWCIGRNSRGFSAWHADVETALEVTDITRIGLYLDFQRGAVSFYNVTDGMSLLHTYTAELIEPLYVSAWLSKKDNGVSLIDVK